MSSFSENYLNILHTDYKNLNLTRILDIEEFEQKQFLDSLLPAQQIDIFNQQLLNKKLCVDIGFGGGFPILPLASCFKNNIFIGFDARNKKVKAVEQISKKMGIENTLFFHERVENVFFDRDVNITFKAVGKIDKFLHSIYGDCTVSIFFYKSMEEEKIDGFKDFKLICNQGITIPGKENIYRRILGYKMVVPRGTVKNRKKLSNFLKK